MLKLILQISTSDVQSECRSKRNGNGSTRLVLEDCSNKFEAEARSSTSTSEATTSSLPSWLQQYKDQNKLPQDNDRVINFDPKLFFFNYKHFVI